MDPWPSARICLGGPCALGTLLRQCCSCSLCRNRSPGLVSPPSNTSRSLAICLGLRVRFYHLSASTRSHLHAVGEQHHVASEIVTQSLIMPSWSPLTMTACYKQHRPPITKAQLLRVVKLLLKVLWHALFSWAEGGNSPGKLFVRVEKEASTSYNRWGSGRRERRRSSR